MSHGTSTAITSRAGIGGRRRTAALRFARHYLIMVVLMYAGMLVLNPVYGLAAGAVGHPDPWTELPTLSPLVMAVNMTVPMTLWMRWHGHRRSAAGEMAAAMVTPTAVAAAAAWAGTIDDASVMTVAHVAMFPAMLAAMLLRKDEYTS